MAFNAKVFRLLISCPGDVPLNDLSIIHRAINRWNVRSGPKAGTVVLPVWWNAHAAAEFGQPPQVLLNRQLVDDCDLCVAIFANRLGTPSATAESGTAEEIQRFFAQKKYVGILRSRRLVNPDTIDFEQANQLAQYLAKIEKNGLVLGYDSDAELLERLENILDECVRRDADPPNAPGIPGRDEPDVYADVSVRVESRSRLRTYVNQQVVTSKDWFLVLANAGDSVATEVTFSIEPAENGEPSWTVLGQANGELPTTAESIGPHTEKSFHIIVGSRTPRKANCAIHWSDARGRQQRSTVLELD